MIDQLERAVELLSEARRILVFTGAGVSTESGIPDFRGPDGIWTKVDPNDFTIERYLESSEVRQRSWAMWGDRRFAGAVPSGAHRAIHELWQADRVTGVVTQNIDGLHSASGLPDSALAELHGHTKQVTCLDCHAAWPTADIIARVAEGEPDPMCTECGGIVKLAVVSFGQMLPQAELMKAQMMAEAADASLAVGTTLSVWPAADFPLIPARSGHPFVIVNRGETDMDTIASVKVEGGAGDVLTELVARLLS